MPLIVISIHIIKEEAVVKVKQALDDLSLMLFGLQVLKGKKLTFILCTFIFAFQFIECLNQGFFYYKAET